MTIIVRLNSASIASSRGVSIPSSLVLESLDSDRDGDSENAIMDAGIRNDSIITDNDISAVDMFISGQLVLLRFGWYTWNSIKLLGHSM